MDTRIVQEYLSNGIWKLSFVEILYLN